MRQLLVIVVVVVCVSGLSGQAQTVAAASPGVRTLTSEQKGKISQFIAEDYREQAVSAQLDAKYQKDVKELQEKAKANIQAFNDYIKGICGDGNLVLGTTPTEDPHCEAKKPK